MTKPFETKPVAPGEETAAAPRSSPFALSAIAPEKYTEKKNPYEGTKYDSAAGMAAAAAAGAYEGLAGPLGTFVAKTLIGGEDELRKVREANPWSFVGGDAVGTGVGIWTGTGLPGVVAKLGSAAKALGGASKIAQSAIQWGTESALYGASHGVSDAILDKHPLRGEEIAAKALQDFGVGALFGGTVGAISKGLAGVMKAEAVQEAAASRFADVAGYNKKISDGIKSARGGESGYYRTVRETWDDAERLAGKKLTSLEDVVSANKKGTEHWGAKIGKILEDAEAAKPGQVDASRVIGYVESAAAKLKSDPTAGPLQSKLEGMAERLREQWTTPVFEGMQGPPQLKQMTLRDVKEISTAFRERFLQTDAASRTPVGQIAKEIRGEMEGEIKRAIENSGTKAMAKEYEAAKGMYQNHMWLSDALDTGINKAVHAPMGIREMAAGAAGMAQGGPLTGTAMAVASKALKTPAANLFIGNTLKNAAAIDVAGAAVDSVRNTVRAGIEKFISDDTTPRIKVKRDTQPTPSAKELTALLKTVHNASTDAVVGSTEQLASKVLDPQVVPGVYTEAVTALSRAAAYLAATAPPMLTKAASLTPMAEEERFSPLQAQMWHKRLEGIRNPYSIVTDMQSGKLSHAKVQAVKAVHPNIYAEIQDMFLGAIGKRKKKLDYGRTVQVCTLFGVPMDQTLVGSFVATMQQSTQPEQQPKQSQGRPSAITDKLGDQLATPADTIGEGL